MVSYVILSPINTSQILIVSATGPRLPIAQGCITAHFHETTLHPKIGNSASHWQQTMSGMHSLSYVSSRIVHDSDKLWLCRIRGYRRTDLPSQYKHAICGSAFTANQNIGTIATSAFGYIRMLTANVSGILILSNRFSAWCTFHSGKEVLGHRDRRCHCWSSLLWNSQLQDSPSIQSSPILSRAQHRTRQHLLDSWMQWSSHPRTSCML